jgi:5-methylthioadenosine/S-adenosylhomocysteine deaminase
VKTALTNVTLLTLDSARRVIVDGCLIVAEDRLAAVGGRAELARQAAACERVLDGRGMVALPGFVNTHTHTFQSLLRGLADGYDLIGFLRNLIYPVSRVITPEDTRAAAALSILEAIKSGTTCLIDNHSGDTGWEATNAIAEVFARSGLRGLVARGLRLPTPRSRAWNVPADIFQFSLAEELEITRHLMDRWHAEAAGRVRVCPAPLTLFLAGPAALQAAKALADEYDAPLHIHVAEVLSEVEATLTDYGYREVEHVRRLGLLDRRFHLVHGVWLDDAELDLLAEAGANVLHCPTSNMNLASGVARVGDMLARGVNVALASDGLGNHNHDMFSVMKTTALLHRVTALQADAMPPAQVLQMAILGGARALGLEDQIGSLEPGKKADLILLDLNRPHLVPVYDLAAAIVFGATAADVDTVMVDGQIIMEGRVVQTLDETEVVAAAQAAGPQLLRRAGLRPLGETEQRQAQRGNGLPMRAH